MSLCVEKRGQITNQTYLTTDFVKLNFDTPLAEIVFGFYDRLKLFRKAMRRLLIANWIAKLQLIKS